MPPKSVRRPRLPAARADGTVLKTTIINDRDGIPVVVEVIQGNLLTINSQAIVNAANATLKGGGGVDGQIHRKAGPELAAEIRAKYPNGCRVGDARLTDAYSITSARHIIHAVGPTWNKANGADNRDVKEDLRRAYINSLGQATLGEDASIAFPTISTGIFGYPPEEAAQVAMRAVREFLHKENNPWLRKITFLIWGTDSADEQFYMAHFDTIFDPKALVEVYTQGIGRPTITYEQPVSRAPNPDPTAPKQNTDKPPVPPKSTTTADLDGKPERQYYSGG